MSQYRSHGYLFNLSGTDKEMPRHLSQYRSHGYLFNHDSGFIPAMLAVGLNTVLTVISLIKQLRKCTTLGESLNTVLTVISLILTWILRGLMLIIVSIPFSRLSL